MELVVVQLRFVHSALFSGSGDPADLELSPVIILWFGTRATV